MKVDAISLGCKSHDAVDGDILSTFGTSALRDPNADLTRTDVVRLAILALMIARNGRAYQVLVLVPIKCVQTHVADAYTGGALTIRAAVVDIGSAVVPRAALRLEGTSATKRTVVAGADDVDALIAQVHDRRVAAEDETHTGRHHVWREAIVHLPVGGAPGRQEQGLHFPSRLLQRIRQVVGIVGAYDGSVLGHEQLLIDFEDPSWEPVNLTRAL
mmetsp:Transcript_102432/g.219157  ORF Transcript_102432/g.219157 Transcript_102432/m.219157 type:complete len:215 (-) Transcript_102432:499-1143(-)